MILDIKICVSFFLLKTTLIILFFWTSLDIRAQLVSIVFRICQKYIQYFVAHQDFCQCLTSIFDRRNKSCSRFRVFQSVVPLNISDLFSHESWMSYNSLINRSLFALNPFNSTIIVINKGRHFPKISLCFYKFFKKNTFKKRVLGVSINVKQSFGNYTEGLIKSFRSSKK